MERRTSLIPSRRSVRTRARRRSSEPMAKVAFYTGLAVMTVFVLGGLMFLRVLSLGFGLGLGTGQHLQASP